MEALISVVPLSLQAIMMQTEFFQQLLPAPTVSILPQLMAFGVQTMQPLVLAF